MKARDLRLIDVRGRTSITDFLVIASGTSNRHVRAMAEEVIVAAKTIDNAPLGVEGEREGEWVLVDLGDVVVHLMQPRTREFYGLERMWGLDVPVAAEAAAAAAAAAGTRAD
ncbi:MAG: ribosome silencing factor [Xanthomonadales bacterium]|nr:ribosome silencing factor [Xanthomonadales bacterium]MCB1633872.1 ribosome silencing factor [Xanthomonadales bacterium]